MDSPVVRGLDSTHLNNPGLHISTEAGILLMIQAANAFVKTGQKSTLFHAIAFNGYAKYLPFELHVRQMKRGEEKFLKFAIFQTNILQTRDITNPLMSLFITTMQPFRYNARDKLKRWEVKSEMRARLLVLKVDHCFNTAESASYRKGVLGEDTMRDVFQKKRLCKKSWCGVQEDFEVAKLEDLEPEVVTPRKPSKMDYNVTTSWLGETEDGTTEIDPNEKTMESTTEKPAGTG